MRILVTGSRDWEDEFVIEKALSEYLMWDCTLVEGGCERGADRIAYEIADYYGMDVETYPADWDKYGKAAGPIRNKEMVDSKPDICLAFIKNKSKGATGCADMAEKAGIKTIRFTE